MAENTEKKDLKILVVGDAMIDKFVFGKMERISDEAPVPIVEYETEDCRLGGAANVAAHIAQLGAQVTLCAVCGQDQDEKYLKEILEETGVDHSLLIEEEDRPTTLKLRVMAGDLPKVQVFRMDREERKDIGAALEHQIITTIQQRLQEFDLVIMADYGKGLLTSKIASSVIRMAGAHDIRVISSARRGTPMKFSRSFLVKINAKDLEKLADMEVKGEKDRNIAMQKIKSHLKAENVLLIQNDESLVLLDRGFKIHEFKPISRKNVDVIGVGATVMAILGVYVGSGEDILEVMKKASIGVGIKLQKFGQNDFVFRTDIEVTEDFLEREEHYGGA